MRESIQGSTSINKVLPSANNPGSYETTGYVFSDDVRVLKSLSPLHMTALYETFSTCIFWNFVSNWWQGPHTKGVRVQKLYPTICMAQIIWNWVSICPQGATTHDMISKWLWDPVKLTQSHNDACSQPQVLSIHVSVNPKYNAQMVTSFSCCLWKRCKHKHANREEVAKVSFYWLCNDCALMAALSKYL